jgi:predicted nucleic-acid-binding Zn-ribbon protein
MVRQGGISRLEPHGYHAAMKTSGSCPKCSGRKLFHITSVEQTYCDALGSLKSFAVASAFVPTGKKGMLGGTQSEVLVAAPYETMVCAGCGYAEWYASKTALAKLARMAESNAIRVLEDGVLQKKPRE